MKVSLRVGDHFIGEGLQRNARRIIRFASFDSAGEKPIIGRDGQDPAGFARIPTTGLAILAYRSNDAFVELEGPKFESYLAEKGLDAISQKRKAAGQTAQKAREAYSRCAKALLMVSQEGAGNSPDATNGRPDQATDRNGNATAADRPVGLMLEIVAETNPYDSKVGDELTFRVLHDGKPLPNALVTATRKGNADKMQSARTDESGRVRFRLADSGVWLIATVHMTPAPPGVDAQWQSIWSSATFEMGGAPSAKTPVLP